MKIERIPLPEIVTIARMVKLALDDQEESETPFPEEDSIMPGTYAMDGEGRVWRLEETVTGLFQELMDANIKRKK